MIPKRKKWKIKSSDLIFGHDILFIEHRTENKQQNQEVRTGQIREQQNFTRVSCMK